MADDLVERSFAAIVEARRLAAENLRLRRVLIQTAEDYGWRVGTVSLFVSHAGAKRPPREGASSG